MKINDYLWLECCSVSTRINTYSVLVTNKPRPSYRKLHTGLFHSCSMISRIASDVSPCPCP